MLRSLMLSLAALMLFVPAVAHAAPEIGKPAPDFTGTDFNGNPVKLSDYKGRITVLEWTNPECPFVRKHYSSGNMQMLQHFARSNNVAWVTINSSAPGKEGNLTADAAKKFFSKAPLENDHYVLDSSGAIGKLYGAKTTPHMFVIDATGDLVYMGAIDNKPTADTSDIASADNYVRDAIEDLLSEKPIAVTSTQSYGCAVKYAD